MPKKKTPDYVRKAVDAYNAKFERFTVSLPPGSKEEIKTRTGKSLNQYFNDLYKADRDAAEQAESPD